MNFLHRADTGRFFCLAALRIICITVGFFGGYVKRFFGGFCSALRGGVAYWSGRVLAGGVDKQGLAGVDFEQGGGTDGGAVGQAAAGACLVIGLPGDSKRGGATGGGVEHRVDGNKECLHDSLPLVSRARCRVQYPRLYRQVVVDGRWIGQSIFSIAPSVGG